MSDRFKDYDYNTAFWLILVAMISHVTDFRNKLSDRLLLLFVIAGLAWRYPIMTTLLFIYISEWFLETALRRITQQFLHSSDSDPNSGFLHIHPLSPVPALYIQCFSLLKFPYIENAVANVIIYIAITAIAISFFSHIFIYLFIIYKTFNDRSQTDAFCVQTSLRIRRIRRRLLPLLLATLVLYGIFFVASAIFPFIIQPEITKSSIDSFDPSRYYADSPSYERTRIVDNNTDALNVRLQMISQAKSRIILSTFDFRADRSGKDMLAALLDAADRGVSIEIFVDGFNTFVSMEGNPYFYALSSHPMIKIIIYNPINFATPWKLMGRMHDKYLIIDDNAYLLGGRNTFNYFLGDYNNNGTAANDRDVLICNSTPEAGVSGSLNELLDYYHSITESKDCTLFHDQQWVAYYPSVVKAREELKERKNWLTKKYGDLLFADYSTGTCETDSIRLISNPIGIYAKEPIAFYEIMSLAANSAQDVRMQMPYVICNDVMYQALSSIGNRTSIIFNSSANSDNPFGATDYLVNKGRLIATGIKLFEYESGSSYHGKSIAIGDELTLIGSFNIDMRSTYIDTELMLVIDSKDLNRSLRSSMSRYALQSAQVNDEFTYYSVPEGHEMQPVSGTTKLFSVYFRKLLEKLRFLL